MATTEANDLQFCLRRILKFLSETCVSCLIKHPCVPLSLLSSFFLYIFFPLVFWVLVYSFPLFVCVAIIVISVNYVRREEEDNVRREEEDNVRKLEHKKPKEEVVDDHSQNVKVKKTIKRVHSVRQRRAKVTDFRTDNEEEEKNMIPTTKFDHETINKAALPEEAPKEIQKVEVINHPVTNNETIKVPAPSPLQTLKAQLCDEGYRLKCLEALRMDDKEMRDDQKNVIMDVGIESNKRLESLIARRRARKRTIHVRRPSITLMNMDKKDLQAPGQQLPCIIIPKHNIGLHFRNSSSIGPLTPGSAPSVLVPMRNPFDLPYDPHEEKPDLTGDSFLKEFLPSNNKVEPVYCRHESFSLGSAFSPLGIDEEGDGTSFEYEAGFGPRFRRFSRAGSDFFDRDFSQMIQQESDKDPKIQSPTDKSNNDGDRIKEIIHEEDKDDVQERTSPVPEQDIASSSWTSRTSSEEEDRVYKIDKEAILKSLSSMVRRHVIEEMENKDHQTNDPQDDDRKTVHGHHAPSYSIASDMQVEVSDSSSPPALNDESLSLTYDEGNISTLDGDAESKHICTNCDSGSPSSPSQVMSEVNNNADEDNRISGTGKFIEDTTLLINSKELDDDHAKQRVHPHEESPSSKAELYNSGEDCTITDLHPNVDDTAIQTRVSSSGALPEGSIDNFPVPTQENEQQEQQQQS